MKQLFLMIIPALICWVVFISCSSDKAQVTEDESKILHGKWQLISISTFNEEGLEFVLIDYAPDKIIYEFRANNVLTVSGNVDNNYYGGHEMGEHYYDVILTEIIPNPLGLPAPHKVRINNIPYGFSFGYMSDIPGMEMVCLDECDYTLRFVKSRELQCIITK